jgi:isopenicillin-N epimerase
MLLDAEVANLNCGSFGPTAQVVFDEATRLRRRQAEEPMDFLIRQLPPLLWSARCRLASFLGAEPRRLVFAANVTAGVNLVASSLALDAPGEVLLTDHEYGCLHWCWERAARRLGLELRTFALPANADGPGPIVEAACRAMTARTRLFFFSHVLSPTGLVLPARELCFEARKRGIVTVVDGAHAPAFVPLDLSTIPFDFYGGNCHKWLLAPLGSGFLCFAPEVADRLEPLQVSWGYRTGPAALDEPDEFGSTPRIRRLEFEGTRDVCPWLAVPEAIDFQSALGFERIRGRMRALAGHVRRRLDWLPVATPDHPDLGGAMVAFELPAGTEPVKLRAGLWRKRVEVNVVERPERLLVRTSTHFFNTEDEVDRLADALPELLREARQ